MKSATLHYLYDPFCGWCYAAAPMLSAAQTVDGIEIEPHGFGMLSGDNARWMAADWRDFVRPHEQRITALSGQTFGEPYVEGVQQSEDVRLDSSPPIVAMLAAQSLGNEGLNLVKRLQVAYYQEGRPIAEFPVLLEMAKEIGLDGDEFTRAFKAISEEKVTSHLDATRQMLQAMQSQGVPGFALEANGSLHVLPFGRYLGRPERFKQELETLLQDTSNKGG
ncbi:hypothetical protein LMG6000_00457 [Achromobacter insolitus]|uniref:DSBA-like thioredoxin domain-containing protein n=2 Tax=Achromobacter insolitus TaxID=217204 RepID=A0A6S7EVP3_9BURK|nr:DsbA family protein [Achromobacter insolitus]CAB3929405.1 hypothetical protein LMG6000_00457 [Achromobacter insolitus]CAB3944986.1 hypothetical protein LMG5997_05508 [Achromobacter insolitus]